MLTLHIDPEGDVTIVRCSGALDLTATNLLSSEVTLIRRSKGSSWI